MLFFWNVLSSTTVLSIDNNRNVRKTTPEMKNNKKEEIISEGSCNTRLEKICGWKSSFAITRINYTKLYENSYLKNVILFHNITVFTVSKCSFGEHKRYFQKHLKNCINHKHFNSSVFSCSSLNILFILFLKFILFCFKDTEIFLL